MRASIPIPVLLLSALAVSACGSGSSEGFEAELTGAREVAYRGEAFFCTTGGGTLYTLESTGQEGTITLARFSHHPPPAREYVVVGVDSARKDSSVFFVPTLTFLGPELVSLAESDSGSVTVESSAPGEVKGRFRLRVKHRGGTAVGISALAGTFTARGGGECGEGNRPKAAQAAR